MAKAAAGIVAAERQLARADPVLRGLIRAHGPCTLAPRARDPFHVLCSSIISQQLSSRAADTIQQRVMARAACDRHLTPAALRATSAADLRACGLSTAKAKWLHALAEAVEGGTFSFAALDALDDEAAIAALDALPGIGRWTAEMHLIFAMHRLDLFAMDDAGLRRAVNRLYGRGKPLSDRRTRAIAAAWAPYRSVASWYLWQSLDAA